MRSWVQTWANHVYEISIYMVMYTMYVHIVDTVIGRYFKFPYFLRHTLPCHLQRCNIMIACGIDQTINNDGLIDQWSSWQLIILTSQNDWWPLGQIDLSKKKYVEIDLSKLTFSSNWTKG
jgi:hypothetical protein